MEASNERWNVELRRARERLGIGRGELSERSGVPVATLRRWEDGSRNPRPGRLQLVLEALNVPNANANRILEAAGYTPAPTLFPPGRFPGYFYTVDELQDVVEEVAWPEVALNENVEVVAANSVVQKLWGVDLSDEFLGPGERNLLRVASDPRFADRCLNWDEVVGGMLAMWKGHHRGPESLEQPGPYFQQLIEDFMAGDPTYVRRFLDLWERTPARTPKIRIHYPVRWRHDEAGELRFLGVQSAANIWEALGWNDWIPADSATWARLENLNGG